MNYARTCRNYTIHYHYPVLLLRIYLYYSYVFRIIDSYYYNCVAIASEVEFTHSLQVGFIPEVSKLQPALFAVSVTRDQALTYNAAFKHTKGRGIDRVCPRSCIRQHGASRIMQVAT